MPNYAMNRPGFNGGGTDALADWFTRQRLDDPMFRAPLGYEWKGDHYERDSQGFVDDLAKWTGRGAVAGSAAMGGATLAGLGPFAAGAGASAAAPSLPVAAGLPTMAGAGAGAGGAAAGGLGGALGTIQKWAPLAGLATGLVGSLRGGGEQEMPFENELSGILNLQRGRMEQSAPLYQAILKMAMGMLPMSARAGFTAPTQTGNPRG